VFFDPLRSKSQTTVNENSMLYGVQESCMILYVLEVTEDIVNAIDGKRVGLTKLHHIPLNFPNVYFKFNIAFK
jgi:hypothetical protein